MEQFIIPRLVKTLASMKLYEEQELIQKDIAIWMFEVSLSLDVHASGGQVETRNQD